MRSSGSQRRSKGVVVAAVNSVDALRLIRSAMEREQRGGERLQAREREVRGLWTSPGARERLEVASRSWSLRPARALSRGDSSSFGARGGRRQEEPLVGWVGFAQCWAGWWAAQVRPGTISFLSFISVFYFFYSVLN